MLVSDTKAARVWRSLDIPFILFSLFMLAVFFTGGSSWSDEPHLIFLRPFAFVVAAIGLWSLRLQHIRQFWAVWLIFGLATLLTAAHLVPLPYDVWSNLPGRQVIVDIDKAVGLGQISRPLSMSPEMTLNALLSLSVPLAVLVLASQFDGLRQRRALGVVLLLSFTSAAVGLLQATGADIVLYARQSPSSAEGLFVNRNHQAALLALIFPMAAVAISAGIGMGLPRKIEAFAGASMCLVTVPLVLVTGSRTGLLVAGVSLVLIFAFGLLPRARFAIKPWVRYSAAFSSVGALVWATIWASRDVAFMRLEDQTEDLRWPVWQSIIDMLPHYLPWGTGVGSYVEAYKVLEPDNLLRPTFSNHAHNEVLEILFTAGIPGAVLVVLALVFLAVAVWRGLRSAGDAALFKRLGIVAIILLAIASLSDYPVRTPILSAVFVLAAIWASASQSLFHKSDHH
jgi:O-antigen ligase